jgi:hypothetical protein
MVLLEKWIANIVIQCLSEVHYRRFISKFKPGKAIGKISLASES